MDEYYIDEQVTVFNPYKAIWESGRIAAKYYSPDQEHPRFYSVQVGSGLIIEDIYDDALLKINIWKDCECGAKASNQPGHSHWCPKFDSIVS